MGEMLSLVSFARPAGPAVAFALGLAVGAWSPSAYAGKPAYDESDGTVDPRKRELPRRHRFRLGLDGGHIRLTSAANQDGTNAERFHWAPLLVDASYQLQFAKVLMLRPGLAAGMNVANSRYAMPLVISPRLFTGYQGRAVGVAAGYAYYSTGFEALTVQNGADGRPNSLGGPRIWFAHAVLGELSFTSRIDGIAITFATRVGAVHSHIQHYSLDSRDPMFANLRKFRLHWGVSLGFYFDGTLKRRKQARAREERGL